MRYHSFLHPCYIFLLILFTATSAYAQGRRFDISHNSTIDVITKEKISEIKVGNMVDMLRFSPETHHINSRTIVYDYKSGMVDKNTQRILYDGMNNPAYMTSVFSDNNGVTLRGIEEVFSGKELKQAFRWNSIDGKVAETYDPSAHKYVNVPFNSSWNPMYNYSPVNPGTIQPMDKEARHQTVTAEFSKRDVTEPLSENIFKGKGEIDYSPKGNMQISETRLYDERGTLRQYTYREYYSDDWEYEEITYYDCDGKVIYFESTMYDDYGYEVEMIDELYKDGKPIAGWRDVDDWDASFREYWNPETDEFFYINYGNEKYANYMWSVAEYMADEPCDDFPYNIDDDIYVGVLLISEDSYLERFNTIGADLGYTHYFSRDFGVVADIGLAFGSQFNADYTKLNLYGGAIYYPFNTLKRADKFSLGLEALAGYTAVTQKYNNSKNKDCFLGGFLGLNLNYDLSKRLGLQVKGGWNPVFTRGNTTSNYLFSGGLRYDF